MSNVYDIVTDRVIALLEDGVCPWRKPWLPGAGLAQNLISRKPYRGVNALLLNCLAHGSAYWLTYNQAKKLGGQVRKGQRGTPVIFWKFLEKEDSDSGKVKTFPMLRYYTVFNVGQCDGLDGKVPDDPDTSEVTPVEPIARDYVEREQITFRHGGGRAFYRPSEDLVQLPHSTDFPDRDEYHSVVFHEITHSTGTRARLGRFDSPDQFMFASDSYSKEELVAEMGAAFLCQTCGISRTIENSAAYLASWLRALKKPSNAKLIVQAAGKAQKAADFILTGEKPNKEGR